jgi:hypothetical protein
MAVDDLAAGDRIDMVGRQGRCDDAVAVAVPVCHDQSFRLRECVDCNCLLEGNYKTTL